VSEAVSNEEHPIRLGVSSCLLGNEVRFDGGHKRDRFVTDLLGRFVEWSGRDHTVAMERFSARRVRALQDLDLCGYILKKDSPSCGMTRVKVYGEKSMPTRKGKGIYASALMQAYPNLPVEDEGRLNDSKLRENFIERVFAYRRLSHLFRGRWSRGQVVAFHTAHKLQVMAHSTVAYRELGRLVAMLKQTPRAAFRERYESGFMQALARVASRGRNANVLQHAAGHLKTHLDAASRTELAKLVHDYREGLVPLVVPVTLIGHYVRRHEVDYLKGQVFLEPHPRELMLRNHV
jgi:uncharacterized protein YbgA (DUF1722 family)/uncharacterized protein YbbK (DUF523 family)